MKKSTFIVGISDAWVSNNPNDLLVTYSLGSCIGLCLYDPNTCIGGMLHCQLPSSKLDAKRSKQNPYMFVDTGLKELINKMENIGANRKKMQVKVAGAAAMDVGPKGFDIGKRNFLAIRKHLWQNYMMIDSQDIGGSEPRNVYFNMADGSVTVKSKGKIKQL